MKNRKVAIKIKGGVLEDEFHQSPVDRYKRRILAIKTGIVVALLIIVAVWLYWRFASDKPVDYTDIADHFKYGSIGSEPGGSLTNAVGGVVPPYWVFKVLPEMFPDKLPGGYASLGLIYEEGRDLPVGVSKRRRLGVDQVGLNCAFCHTGTYRASAEDEPIVLPGMPANALDIQGFFKFVLEATLDERFTAENVLGKIRETGGTLGWLERQLYRLAVVPAVKQNSLKLKGRIEPLLSADIPQWGFGRVDTFNPYKAIQFNWPLAQLPKDQIIGASDYPSLWWQNPREGMQLHWDGNNTSLQERNLSASLGAGVTPVTIDHARLEKVAQWIGTLPPPKYPYTIDGDLADRGEAVYRQNCAGCHGDHRFREGVSEGAYLGKVSPIEEIGTDPYRLNSYTKVFAANQYSLYPDSAYRFNHFRKTQGYSNQPLDGIWARAPYLHNGSVPTLRDLMEAPESRPVTFYRGNDIYDPQKLGFVHDAAELDGRALFLFDTTIPGNGNDGHLYGIDLSDEEKDAIVEYMKRF